jgi:hypothetical protein
MYLTSQDQHWLICLVENLDVKPAMSMRLQIIRNHTLPTELLREIFLYLQDEEGMNNTLCLVCRMWRMVTISISSLWTNIWLVPKVAKIPVSELVPRLELLGKRSGWAPLNIKWNLSKDTYPDDAAYKALLECMAEVIPVSRWKSLDVFSGGYAPDNIDILASVTQCNNFERLGLFTDGSSLRNIFWLLHKQCARPKTLYSSADTLLDLSYEFEDILSSVKVFKGKTMPSRVLASMSSLEIIRTEMLRGSSYSVNQCLRLVQVDVLSIRHLLDLRCPNLETLEADYLVMENPQAVEFRHLRTLRVNSEEFSPIYLFRVPQLETLHINAPDAVHKSVETCMAGNLEEPEYSLSPTVLDLDIRLSIPLIKWTLRRSPRTQHVRLLIYKKAGSIDELMKALAQPMKSSSRQKTDPSPQYLCQDLRTVHVKLDWDTTAVSTTPLMKHSRQSWVQKATTLLKARLDTVLEEVTIQWQDGHSIHLTRQGI